MLKKLIKLFKKKDAITCPNCGSMDLLHTGNSIDSYVIKCKDCGELFNLPDNTWDDAGFS